MAKFYSLLILIGLIFINPLLAQEEIVALVGNKIMKIDVETGFSSDFLSFVPSESNMNLSKLAYNKENKLFYTIIRGTTNPALGSISLNGEFRNIGLLKYNGSNIQLVEGLTYNNLTNKLYAAVSLNGGTAQNDFYSESIVEIDIETGECTLLTTISTDKANPDIDAMTFDGNFFYLFDGAPPGMNFTAICSLKNDKLGQSSMPTKLHQSAYVGYIDMSMSSTGVLFLYNNNVRKYNLDANTFGAGRTIQLPSGMGSSTITGLSDYIPTCHENKIPNIQISVSEKINSSSCSDADGSLIFSATQDGEDITNNSKFYLYNGYDTGGNPIESLPVITKNIERVQHSISTTNNTNQSASFSSPVKEGNLLVATSFHTGTAATPAISGSGWSLQIVNIFTGSNSRAFAVWSKIAGPSESQNITSSWSSPVENTLLIQEFEIPEGYSISFDSSTSPIGESSLETTSNTGTIPEPSTSNSFFVTFLGIRGAGVSPVWSNGVSQSVGDAANDRGLYSGYGQTSIQGEITSTASWEGGRESIAGLISYNIISTLEHGNRYVDLGSGEYTLIVENADGCKSLPHNVIIELDDSVFPFGFEVQNNRTCEGALTNSGRFSITTTASSIGQYEFVWNDTHENEIVGYIEYGSDYVSMSNLDQGHYYVRIQNLEAGCVLIKEFTIENLPVVGYGEPLTSIVEANTTCDAPNGAIITSANILGTVLNGRVNNENWQPFSVRNSVLGGNTIQSLTNGFNLTSDQINQNGRVWFGDSIDISKPQRLDFRIYLGDKDSGGDGMALTMHRDPRGYNAQGRVGGNLGVGQILPSAGTETKITPAVSIEFDTWQNNEGNDPSYDHTNLFFNGDINTSALGGGMGANLPSIHPTKMNVEDSDTLNVSIIISQPGPNQQRIELWVDSSLRFTYDGDIINDVFSGESKLIAGFTANTGGAANEQALRYTPAFNNFTYQWRQNGELIEGADDYFISDLSSGDYSIRVFDRANGCEVVNDAYEVPNQFHAIENHSFRLDYSVKENTSCLEGNGYIHIEAIYENDELLDISDYAFIWYSELNQTLTNNILSEGNANSYKIENLKEGKYYFHFYNLVDNCTFLKGNKIEINRNIGLIFESSVTDVICNGESNGVINVEIQADENYPNHPSTFSYEWKKDGTFLSSNVTSLVNLQPGNYELAITDPAENGCSESFDFIILDYPQILINPTVSNVSCPNGADGEISLDITGGRGSYEIEWRKVGQDGIIGTETSISNLTAGSYMITVSDGYCIRVENLSIIQPNPITISPQLTHNTCKGGTDGAISVEISGGTAPYTLSWTKDGSFYSANQDLTNLEAGDYSLTITDANDCIKEVDFRIEEPNTTFTISLDDVTSNTCKGDGSGRIGISIIIDEGHFASLEELTIQWYKNNIPLAYKGLVLDQITDGTYAIEVSDGTCTIRETIELGFESQFAGTLALASKSDNTQCGSTNGSATVTVQNPNADGYTYQWFSGGSTSGTPISTTTGITNAAPGTYTVRATDLGSGCTSALQVSIGDSPLSFDTKLEAIDNTHCAAANGTVRVAAMVINGEEVNSTGGYGLEWSNSAAFATILSKSREVTGLASGTYYLRAKDLSSGCTSSPRFVALRDAFAYPDYTVAADANTYCGEVKNGKASLTGVAEGMDIFWYRAGSEAPIEGATAGHLSNVDAGEYSVKVVNKTSGCATTKTFTIANQPTAVAATFTVSDNTFCEGGNGTATLNVLRINGGVEQDHSQVVMEWSTKQDFSDVFHEGNKAEGLKGGTYYARVRHKASGCASPTYTLTLRNTLVQPQVQLAAMKPDRPGRGGVGSLTVQVSGIPADKLDISWHIGAGATGLSVGNTISLEKLVAGEYTVRAKHKDTGCTSTTTFALAMGEKDKQNITFSLPTSLFQSQLPIKLMGVSDSALAVSYRITEGTGKIEGDMLVEASSGKLTIEAYSDGTEAIAPASAKASVNIVPIYDITIKLVAINQGDNITGAIRLLTVRGELVSEHNFTGTEISVKALNEGEYKAHVVFTGQSIANYYDAYYPGRLFWSQAGVLNVRGNAVHEISIFKKQPSNTLATGVVKGVALASTSGSRITIGRTLSGTPLPGAKVYLLLRSTGEVLQGTTSASDGRFEFMQVATGQYLLGIDGVGYEGGELQAPFDYDEKSGRLEMTIEVGKSGLTIEYFVVAGLDDVAESLLQIYPNPSAGRYTVALAEVAVAQLGFQILRKS